jgi:uncharacterized protein (TIGR00369 family)
MDTYTDDQEFVSAINDLFSEQIPFNKVLGLKVESLGYERVKASFRMKDELMGHHKRGMLHGGVILSVIDVTGGLSAFMGFQEKKPDESLEEKIERFGRVSTIDLRIDFLRPGVGELFVITAYTLRTGNKVAATRTELINDRNDLIAVGSGSYVMS